MLVTPFRESPLKQKFVWLLGVIGLSKVWYLIIIGVAFAAFGAGIYFDRKGLLEQSIAVLRQVPHAPLNYLAALNSSPKQLIIDIKHLDVEKLSDKRQKARKTGILITEPGDFVPARVSDGTASHKAKVRLKGDLSTHFNTSKWSFRIKLKGDSRLWGMKKFSIQHPKTREYLEEWVALQAMKRESIITPVFEYVDVTINGERRGIYALEEHFDKRLVESNGNREGPIIKFREDYKWLEFLRGSYESEYGSFRSSQIDGYVKTYEDNAYYLKAISLLEDFRRGELKTSDVFDSEKLATFIALKDLFGSPELDWNDFRFYYNPVTSKLEPVAFDIHTSLEPIDKLFNHDGGVKKKARGWVELPDSLVRLFFNDRDFSTVYARRLAHISSRDYLRDLKKDLAQDLEANLAILHRDYPLMPPFPWHVYEKNARFIRSSLSPPKAIRAYVLDRSATKITVEAASIQSFPVRILGLDCGENCFLANGEDTWLDPKESLTPLNYTPLTFQVPARSAAALNGNELYLRYALQDRAKAEEERVTEWPRKKFTGQLQDLARNAPNYRSFPFVQVDSERRVLRFHAGSWVVDRPLIIPKDYAVHAGPGLRLDLVNGAMILSESPMEFIGSQDSPIVIESRDSTGFGLMILNAKTRSTFQHVVFKNLSVPDQKEWGLTGAVTIYQAPVEISKSRFVDNRAEDSLNVIRSSFNIFQTQFENSDRDAFDSDFSNGVIRNSLFANSGNDAIDLSGSQVEIESVNVEATGDKAFSFGEDSQAVLRNSSVNVANIAVATKDMSRVTVENLSVTRAEIGFVLLQKKPEFGPASMTVTHWSHDEVKQEFLVEEGSSLEIDGALTKASGKKLRAQFYQ